MRSLAIRHYVTVLAFVKTHVVVAYGHLNVDARDLKEDIMLFHSLENKTGMQDHKYPVYKLRML